jgi:hypothetical protein
VIFESLTVDEVTQVVRTTENALGASSRRIGEAVKPIRDWNPNFAFTHVLHHVTALLGHLPTWQEFRDFASSDSDVRPMLWEPAMRANDAAVAAGYPTAEVRNAMQWRIGNAYYSFVREAFIVAQLNAVGLKPKFHPLVDALFRVDLWVDDVNINLFVGNQIYRDGFNGRKVASSQILSDARPPFRNLDIQLPIQHTFGNVHLPKPEAITEILQHI